MDLDTFASDRGTRRAAEALVGATKPAHAFASPGYATSTGVFFPIDDLSFIARVLDELRRARDKFPGVNPTVAAITEEAGEVAKAVLHIREGQEDGTSDRVIAEAVQVAVMAMRLATEGDLTLVPNG